MAASEMENGRSLVLHAVCGQSRLQVRLEDGRCLGAVSFDPSTVLIRIAEESGSAGWRRLSVRRWEGVGQLAGRELQMRSGLAIARGRDGAMASFRYPLIQFRSLIAEEILLGEGRACRIVPAPLGVRLVMDDGAAGWRSLLLALYSAALICRFPPPSLHRYLLPRSLTAS